MNPVPEWSAYREASYGYGVLKVVNASHAYWSWHRNLDSATVVADEIWLESLVSKPACVLK
jgi:hypothetical protein